MTIVKKIKRKVISIATAAAIGALALTACADTGKEVSSDNEKLNSLKQEDFLKAEGKELVNQDGQIVYLRGTNAGGYLLQEFWMTPTSNSPKVNDQQGIIDVLTKRFGEEKAFALIHAYEDAYWTEEDFRNCADMGMNCIRLPFWWRNLMDSEGRFYGYDESAEDPYTKAFEKMDWFVNTAGQYGLYVILDCHGAPGSQNGSDHSGLDGGDNKMARSNFWFGKGASENKDIYYDMWKVLAKRYAGNPVVVAYDLLNEPFCTYRYDMPTTDEQLHTELWKVYDEAYRLIRSEDADHIIIMEAVWDAVDLPNPNLYGWENVMYEYHNYLYDDYDNKAGQQISNMKNKINGIKVENYNVPSYMGEFNYFNNLDAWDEGLRLLNDSNLSWTTWTYKTVESYGNWGLYHHPSTMNGGINIETASYEEILQAWQAVGTKDGKENTALISVIKKWCNGGAE